MEIKDPNRADNRYKDLKSGSETDSDSDSDSGNGAGARPLGVPREGQHHHQQQAGPKLTKEQRRAERERKALEMFGWDKRKEQHPVGEQLQAAVEGKRQIKHKGPAEVSALHASAAITRQRLPYVIQ